jgi:hypothetical protein
MPRMGFEPTIPVFERAKTVHALDRAATVFGSYKTAKFVAMGSSVSSRLSMILRSYFLSLV